MDFSHFFQPVPISDWISILLLFGGIGLLIFLSELLRQYLQWPGEFTRKFVHILVGVMMFFIPILLQSSLPMVLIAAVFTIVNWVTVRKQLLPAMNDARESYGTAYYPFAFLILVLFAWPDHIIIIIIAMLVLALADTAAAIVGESLPSPHKFSLTGDEKSLEGSLAMWVVSFLVIATLLYFPPYQIFSGLALSTALGYAALTATIATAAETLSRKGSDNLIVPLSVALVIYFLLTRSSAEIIQFSLGMLLGGIAAILFWKLRLLATSGAMATFLLATVIFGFGGWQWTLPILAFFIPSSLLSKVGKRIKTRYDLVFEKGSERDFAQVFANGGVPGIIMIVYMLTGNDVYFLYYLAALAAASADTWATELGTLVRHQPRLITTLRKVAAGTSGGITFPGTISATAGAALIAFSSFVFPIGISWGQVGLITLAGLAGSMIDSLLGATIQVQYRCEICGKVTEKTMHCEDRPTGAFRGISWINNDIVNIASIIGATILMALLLK